MLFIPSLTLFKRFKLQLKGLYLFLQLRCFGTIGVQIYSGNTYKTITIFPQIKARVFIFYDTLMKFLLLIIVLATVGMNKLQASVVAVKFYNLNSSYPL